MEVARQLCKEEGSPDNIDGASLFTVDAFHWGVSVTNSEMYDSKY